MAIYLDFAGFKDLTIIPSDFVDQVEAVSPGWVEKQLDYWGRWIDSRLRKRYASPFAAFDAVPPTPLAVQGWLCRLVTVRVMLKRGVDTDDLQYPAINADAELVRDELTEAANSEEGLFDLPLRTDENGSLITQANPLSNSQQSPYVWTDLQQATGIVEDENGQGTDG